MEKERTKGNKCPVCGQVTKENEVIIYCESCGFNIHKKEEETKPISG